VIFWPKCVEEFVSRSLYFSFFTSFMVVGWSSLCRIVFLFALFMYIMGRGFGLVVRAAHWHAGDPGSNPLQGRPLYIWMYTPSAVSFLGINNNNNN
jgi:hypothetical protein